MNQNLLVFIQKWCNFLWFAAITGFSCIRAQICFRKTPFGIGVQSPVYLGQIAHLGVYSHVILEFMEMNSKNMSFQGHSAVLYAAVLHRVFTCLVGYGCGIQWLHLCGEVRQPPMSVLDMTLKNLMVRFEWCWSFGECGVPLHCHCSLVHSGPEW